MTVYIDEFIEGFSEKLFVQNTLQPWEVTTGIQEILIKLIAGLNDEYDINDGIAIHKTAHVESGAVIKGPAIVSRNCIVSAHAYFREGVYLAESVKIGAGCELKSCIVFHKSAIAHFNYIGNSIIGNEVNFEAGSIAANHYNERDVKEISVLHQSQVIKTGVTKFGALVGDRSKIGANAVLSPGTILQKNSIVNRLELIDQVKSF